MIAKLYRLDEFEVRKVLRTRKPFFSYTFIANILPNRLGYNRYGIIFSGKNTRTSIARNFYRRMFYDGVAPFIDKSSFDIVFVPKKGKVFDKDDEATILDFKQTVIFLSKKIMKEGNTVVNSKVPENKTLQK